MFTTIWLSLLELLKLLSYWKYSDSPAQLKENKAPGKVEEYGFILFFNENIFFHDDRHSHCWSYS